jgi:DNA mismatch repair endonuclease MutH
MFASTDPGRGRQEVGHAVEAWFGIAPNPMQAPDFPGAAIELKTVPLVLGTRGLRVKERTVVSLIDFVTLAGETWETASVRKKLRILFVFFEHLRGRPKKDYPIHSVVLWTPSDEIEDQIRRDWEAVHEKVLAGRAHELSEADGRILGPCTKGADSSVLRAQPFSNQFAKSRAFALKPSFTFALYVEPAAAPLAPERIAESASQDELQRKFRRFIGRTVGEVARELEVKASVAKNYAAWVVMKAVLDASPLPASEFKLVGPTVRVPRVGPDLLPYEAVSFPAFRHMELAEETWEDSALLSYVEHMLIAPILGAAKETQPDACVIQEPVYWRPTAEQLELIETEWTRFRDLVAAGKADSLPRESQTSAIHVRPHAQDSTDRDPTPGGGSQMKKSFWLNKRFVQQILIGD